MQFNKILPIILILTLLTCFAVFETIRKSDRYVIGIEQPNIIQVDLNGNKIFDKGEEICIPQIETLTSNISKNQLELENKLHLTTTEGIKLGYLTDNFAESLLLNKNVKLKYTGEENQNCKYADIIVDKKSYRESLIQSGLGFYQGKPVLKQAYKKQLEKAKKLNLVILNHRSNKYHKLDCQYGLVARDVIIIPKQQLPSDAKPCKFCHITQTSNNKTKPAKVLQKTYPLAISNGSIKMYLTDLTTKLKPDKKCSSLACQEILTQINSAQNSIDIALYGWDAIDEVQNALINAKSRGVKIRIVYDTSRKEYYPDTYKIIKIADESATEGKQYLMHNKFMIFDSKRVVTGSMNFSDTGFSGFNTNSVFFINSVEVAQMYLEEFNQMLSGKFHNAKSYINHKTVILNDAKVTPLFSPKDSVITTAIIPLIDNAQKYIYVPAFILTHDSLANSLARAKQRGVDVKLIIDATNTYATQSKVKMLRAVGAQVKIENYAGKVHSKSIIIDDKYVIAGSMNFTMTGENKNDENTLIIENERLAKYYRGFFEYLWSKIPDKYLKQGVRAEGKYSIGSCNDGIDNNYDGKIDKEDWGCRN